MNKINGYDLSRKWFDFCFENPEKVRPIHTAIYFFAIEHCNRLGWKEKFGFPSQMVMEAIGIKNWRTYSNALNEIIDFGFIEMVEISKNQYSSNIIAIVNFTKATTKALDKALSKHSTKHSQSTVSINKQKTKNKEQRTRKESQTKKSLHSFLKDDFLNWYKHLKKTDYYWTAKDGSALKQIINKLKFSTEKEKVEISDEIIRATFRKLIKSINDNWINENLSVPIINSKYNEIVTKIKSGTSSLEERILRNMEKTINEN